MSEDTKDYAILIVDDEEIVVRAIKRVLACCSRKNGGSYVTFCASTGEEAKAVLRANKVDCVLLDYHLDGSDTLLLLEEMLDYDRDLPIIMMSGFCDQETISAAESKGVAGWLNKGSMSSQHLEDLIRKAVGRCTS